MPLCMEVDLGPGHVVLDGDPPHQRKEHSSLPPFSAHVLWPRLPISATAELLFKSRYRFVKYRDIGIGFRFFRSNFLCLTVIVCCPVNGRSKNDV